MNTFILILIWSTSAHAGGISSTVVEFNSRETCEVAREALVKAHAREIPIVQAQGCFKK